MANIVRVDAELSIKQGKLAEFKALADRIVAKVGAGDPNVLTWELYISEDGGKCNVVEMYKDSAAIMGHLGNVGGLVGALLEMAPATGLKVYGNPSDEVRQALAPLAAQYFEHFNGVTRN